jgi:hypothetical protein
LYSSTNYLPPHLPCGREHYRVRLSQSEGLEIRARGLREEDWHAGGIWSIREGGLRVSGLVGELTKGDFLELEFALREQGGLNLMREIRHVALGS